MSKTNTLALKSARELDRYRSRANVAQRRARELPMETAKRGAGVAVAVSAAYGAARTQVEALDSDLAMGVVGAAVAAIGAWQGSADALAASTGLLCVAAHNLSRGALSAPATPKE